LGGLARVNNPTDDVIAATDRNNLALATLVAALHLGSGASYRRLLRSPATPCGRVTPRGHCCDG